MKRTEKEKSDGFGCGYPVFDGEESWNARLKDARIDKIFEPTRDEVVLNLRTRTENFRLFLSARSGSARACITQETFENPAVPLVLHASAQAFHGRTSALCARNPRRTYPVF